jgi:diadenosine tetraphosphate (Ap4A) HIT family hydrolase
MESEFAVSFFDGFPITQCHSLVIPRRHVASLFELTEVEQVAVWKLVTQVRASLAAELQPDGFNVGINDGMASGQTVMHAHVHIIPRHKGDVADPRGGVRWIMPDKARYWNEG